MTTNAKTCPSNHWNDGTDICADCGADLNVDWMKEARRYALHIYCYEELVDDHQETFEALRDAGVDCYDAVEQIGEKYDLDRVDRGWGIHHDVKFERAL